MTRTRIFDKKIARSLLAAMGSVRLASR